MRFVSTSVTTNGADDSSAAALFPAEFMPWPPRSYVERLFNITRWTEMPRGGHFAALEEPALLVDDIRAFARTLR